MANPEHLSILKQGVQVWNNWRSEKPNIRPDLRTADLFRFHLKGAFLLGVNLCSCPMCQCVELRIKTDKKKALDAPGSRK